MALREINLADPDISYQRFLQRHLLVWVCVLLLVVGLIFGFYLYQTRIAMAHKGPVTNLDELQKHLGARIFEIKQVQDQLDKLDKQQSAIEVITKNQPFAEIIRHLAQKMNPDTWLTRLLMNTGAQDAKIRVDLTMSGYSFTNDELGKFITQLNRDSMFANVVLKYAREGEIARRVDEKDEKIAVVQFEIAASLPSSQ